MSLQHIQKNSPRLLPKPAKFEKNPPNGYRVIRKTKCGAGGAGSSPIHKQASLAGRLTSTGYKLKQKTRQKNFVVYGSDEQHISIIRNTGVNAEHVHKENGPLKSVL